MLPLGGQVWADLGRSDVEERPRCAPEVDGHVVCRVRQHDIAVAHARENERLSSWAREAARRQRTRDKARAHATILGLERASRAHLSGCRLLIAGLWMVAAAVDARPDGGRIGGERIGDVAVPESGFIEAHDERTAVVYARACRHEVGA